MFEIYLVNDACKPTSKQTYVFSLEIFTYLNHLFWFKQPVKVSMKGKLCYSLSLLITNDFQTRKCKEHILICMAVQLCFEIPWHCFGIRAHRHNTYLNISQQPFQLEAELLCVLSMPFLLHPQYGCHVIFQIHAVAKMGLNA